jgi:hypothetical protein
MNRTAWLRRIALGAALLALPAGAMILQNYTPQNHDRYYAGGDRAFIGEAYDWSGIARSPEKGLLNPWVVMVSPTFYLTVAHNYPYSGHTVTFDPDNVAGGTTYTYTDSGYQYVILTDPDGPGPLAPVPSDLMLRRLTTPVDPSIAIYPIGMAASLADYANLELWHYSYGNLAAPERVGRNEINNDYGSPDFVMAVNGSPITQATVLMAFDFDAAPGGVGADEMLYQYGDSGSPTFVVVNGQLALIGLAEGIDPTYPNLIYDAFVPYYFSQIANAIWTESGGTESLSYVWIPEPAAALLLLLPALLPLRRRPRLPAVTVAA